MKLSVVIKVQYYDVECVLKLLRSEGLTPVAMDQPDPTTIQTAKGNYLVRIAVPPQQVPKAQEALHLWLKASEKNAEQLGRQLRKHLIFSALPPAVFLVVMAFIAENLDSTAIGVAVVMWIGCFLALEFKDRKSQPPTE